MTWFLLIRLYLIKFCRLFYLNLFKNQIKCTKAICPTSAHSNSSTDGTLILAYVLRRIDAGLYLYGFYIAPLLREEHIKCVQEKRRPIDNILLLIGNFVIYRGIRYREYFNTRYTEIPIYTIQFLFLLRWVFKWNIHRYGSWRLKPLTLGLQSQHSSSNKDQQKEPPFTVYQLSNVYSE